MPALHAELRARLLARQFSWACTRGLQLAPAEDSLRAAAGSSATTWPVSGWHAACCACSSAWLILHPGLSRRQVGSQHPSREQVQMGETSEGDPLLNPCIADSPSPVHGPCFSDKTGAAGSRHRGHSPVVVSRSRHCWLLTVPGCIVHCRESIPQCLQTQDSASAL